MSESSINRKLNEGTKTRFKVDFSSYSNNTLFALFSCFLLINE